MIILGIDPGTRRIGYGAIKSEHGKLKLISAGILKIKNADDVLAMQEAKKQIDAIIEKIKPKIFAVEKLYFAKNQKTALSVAQARGAIILSAIEHGMEVRELAPNEVKLGITGYGFADKKAVFKMVKLFLGTPKLDIIDDASDALAVAIVAARKPTH
ncbi:MAG: crossover junction endodeoxyribonuclease RuvC [Candidatus Liptonbacteria bacterium]|nr:crossover junction endodeoxyribonuclease RuvC [Candidatus Liptonbacteria bacterium]